MKNRIDYLIQRAENESICANCKYYIEHYVKTPYSPNTMFTSIDEGHCTYPRLKNRKAWNSCGYWQGKEEKTNMNGEREYGIGKE